MNIRNSRLKKSYYSELLALTTVTTLEVIKKSIFLTTLEWSVIDVKENSIEVGSKLDSETPESRKHF